MRSTHCRDKQPGQGTSSCGDTSLSRKPGSASFLRVLPRSQQFIFHGERFDFPLAREARLKPAQHTRGRSPVGTTDQALGRSPAGQHPTYHTEQKGRPEQQSLGPPAPPPAPREQTGMNDRGDTDIQLPVHPQTASLIEVIRRSQTRFIFLSRRTMALLYSI